jgi:prepilin-type N-terminal cleavage/methylation domain-containing protein
MVNRKRSAALYGRGFTLIELLVVISIIALLISILLPALGSAREAAVAVQCQAQIRSVSQAAIMYTVDNSEYYPNIWSYNTNVPGNWMTWAEQIASYLGMIGRQASDGSSNNIASADNPMIICPDMLLPPSVESGAGFNWTTGIYGPNPNIMPQVTATGTAANQSDPRYPGIRMKDSLVQDKSRNVMFTDVKQSFNTARRNFNWSNWGGNMHTHFSSLEPNYTRNWEWWDARDGSGSNGVGSMAYADGHGDQRTMLDMNGDWSTGDFSVDHESWYSD